MDDVFRPYIDAGEIMVFSIDTIDNETWADHGGDPRQRIEQHERWFNYIVDEMVPQIRHLAGERNWCQMLLDGRDARGEPVLPPPGSV